jgi:hypothetical protein
MANAAFITFDVTWRPEPTACRQCEVCDEVIYSTAYRLFLNEDATDLCVCASCYDAIQHLT